MTLSELIEKYPKIFQQYEGNPGMVNWSGIHEGWIPIIDDLCGSIQCYIDNTSKWSQELERFVSPEQVVCTQMKEKYGGLRFYTNGHDDVIEGMITMAEYLCYNICQDCGSKEDLGETTKGWLSRICRTCAIAQGDRAMNSWEPIKK